jgi:metacaspase-1
MNYLIQIALNNVSPTKYNGWFGQLTDCVLDLANLAKYLPKSSVIYRLTTENATKQRVSWAFANVAKTAKAGDLVLVQYSGHGGQMPDLNGDEVDNLDETWCLFDGQVIDDEINQWLQLFAAGVKIVIFSDSCHSATVAKISPGTVPKKEGAFWEFLGKLVTSPVVGAIVTAAIQRRDGSMPNWYKALLIPVAPIDKIKASVLLIAGCQDRQSSVSTGKGGIFTNALVKELSYSTPNSFGTIFKNIVKDCVKNSGQEPSWLELGTKFDWKNFKF